MPTPSWMSGYVGDVAYTLGFYREMAPAFLNHVCITNGCSGVPQRAGLRYCELGCGLGYGTALLAAANPDMEFVGIDFNPTHIGEARVFAEKAGIGNVTFLEASFGEAALSTDPKLAPFDIVALHGVYSWVSPEVRESIHDFMRAKLSPGGIAYISYNTYPGWAAAAPLQRLLKEHADRTVGDSIRRVASGREVLKTLVEKSSRFTEQNPELKQRIERMGSQNPQYVAHEYLNEHWQPLYVTEAISALADAKLTFVGSATVGDNRPTFAVPTDLIPLLESAPDVAMRELIKDYAVNKSFRRDVYIKGPTRITGPDLMRRFDELAFAMVTRPDPLPDEWRIPAGTASSGKRSPETILALLASGPATCGKLREAAKEKGIPDGEFAAVLDLLIENRVISPCRGDFASIDRTASLGLNATVFDLTANNDTHRFLAAPVLGSAISATFIDRMLAPLVVANPEADDSAIAAMLFDQFETSGKAIQRDGKPIERSPQSEAEFAALINAFRQKTLPRWREFGAAV